MKVKAPESVREVGQQNLVVIIWYDSWHHSTGKHPFLGLI